MKRRRHVCEWQWCGEPAVGYRHHWRFNVLIRFWFCRRHQRRWDAGTRQLRRGRAQRVETLEG